MLDILLQPPYHTLWNKRCTLFGLLPGTCFAGWVGLLLSCMHMTSGSSYSYKAQTNTASDNSSRITPKHIPLLIHKHIYMHPGSTRDHDQNCKPATHKKMTGFLLTEYLLSRWKAIISVSRIPFVIRTTTTRLLDTNSTRNKVGDEKGKERMRKLSVNDV